LLQFAVVCLWGVFDSHCKAAELQALRLPPTPRLLLNSNGLVALKERIASEKWARQAWAELVGAAEKSLAAPFTLPPRGGNWSHNYVCPSHGARLSQGKQLGPWQWEHICPVGHHVLKGDPSKATLDFDGNAIAGSHFNLAQQTVNDGLIFQVTGDSRYARKAREILMAYCERYLTYPLHDNQGKSGSGGRVASQSLTEATWLIEIAEGADLVWATLSPDDRRNLEEKVLRPALDQVILPRRLGIHNIQCRHNSAIGLVGFLLADQKLIATALDDPQTGFRQQIEKGVRGDGLWLEGSSGYHYFTISGLWPLAEAARNCGVDLYTPKFRSMFDGPMALAMPDLVLPNFNDSGTVPLRTQADLYELAYARFRNPDYQSLLASSDRRGRLALLFGLPLSGATPTIGTSRTSRNLSASGYAILQRGNGEDATWLCLKYGPHGGGHGHPDKNSFILYSRGQILGTDAGTHAYGSPLHKDWDKTTLAHNTLVVDESSQEPATGRCLAFGSERGVEFAVTDAGPIYKGVAFTRAAALLDSNVVVFVDQIQADAPHTYDLAYHQIGTWIEPSRSREGEPWSSARGLGYTHLTQARSRKVNSGGLTVRTRSPGFPSCSVVLSTTQPTETIRGYGILKTTEDLVPMLVQRRSAQNAAFVWAISLDGEPVELATKTVIDEQGKELALSEAAVVDVTTKTRHWSLLVNPHGKKLVTAPGAQPTQARLTVY
jgi:hypothetical protein